MTAPSPRESDTRVLPFRRPGTLLTRNAPRPAVPDLGKYERAPNDEPDDFRHRMLMNGLGFAIAVVLVVAGIWIADVMAHMRRDQDCVLAGRTNCAVIDAPVQQR